ncbi:MAG TPA: SRPBCC family protein [Candidatus Limnocylindrales bacterium]
MQLDHAFAVRADPDETFAFLLDVNRVAGCIPGIAGVEERDPDTFVGTLKVKVGPVGISYRGTATIVSRDPAARRATLSAEGIEGVGAGRVRATAQMAVDPSADGSNVTISTDLAIAGRLAGFGRGIIDGVAKRIVADMANCIRTKLETAGATPAEPAG